MIADFIAVYKKNTPLRFLLVGAINALFGFSTFSILVFFHLHYSLAIFLATTAGILFNFFSYGSWVFNNNDPRLIFRFLVVYLFLYSMNVLLLSVLLSWNMNIYLAEGGLLILWACSTYKLNKDFVYRTRKTVI